jgi:hypothetical protein
MSHQGPDLEHLRSNCPQHSSDFAMPAGRHKPQQMPRGNQPFALRLGDSSTRHVVVARASSRFLASVMRASAVASRRPVLSTQPLVRIKPLVSLRPRTNETTRGIIAPLVLDGLGGLWDAVGRIIDTYTPADSSNRFAAAGSARLQDYRPHPRRGAQRTRSCLPPPGSG